MKIYCTMGYVPNRFLWNAKPQHYIDRNLVFRFKDGFCDESIMTNLVNVITNKIIPNNDGNSLICFIPASTDAKTAQRYSLVATELERRTGVKAELNAIRRSVDRVPRHVYGGEIDPVEGLSFYPEYFKGKNIILIDDVWRTGDSMVKTALELKHHGATNVTGLCVAIDTAPGLDREMEFIVDTDIWAV